jgi:2-polyprenyl-6-hydroxyphenyl methylase/3-demethylubiquinone-9 3-methyltransferase
MSGHAIEIENGERFSFGQNWARFLEVLTDERIRFAEESLKGMLEVDTLAGRRFLDIGCGSGLFSLVARRLGAQVHSFDYDPHSVACTTELRRRYFPDDSSWSISTGSVLDIAFMRQFGEFDVVYSWGVLHHTGAMWNALDNAASLVKENGKLFIAIYNDQGRTSRKWLAVKRAYNRLPLSVRWVVLWPAFVRLWGPTILRDILRRRPFETWRGYGTQKGARGMNPWRDVVDWVGGLPFEVATPEAIFEFHRTRGFRLDRMVTCGGGLGCNEFVFTRVGRV